MDAALRRAQVYIESSRWAEARTELGRVLAGDPDSPLAHAWAGLCSARLNDRKAALGHAQTAVALAPDWPYAHLNLAYIHLAQGDVKKAERSALEAVRLDPDDADHHGMIGHVFLAQGEAKNALVAAERGLAIEPDNSDCLHIRSASLSALGRSAEATENARYAASLEPDDDGSHNAMGWVALRAGRHREAREHFREALRLDASSETAREGLLESLRASFPPYAFIVRYRAFLERFPPGMRFGLFFLAVFGVRVFGSLTRGTPAALFGKILLGFWAVFMYTLWIGPALADAILLFHPMGKYALDRPARIVGRWTQALVALTLVCAGVAAFTKPTNVVGMFIGGGLGLILVGLCTYLSTPKLKVFLTHLVGAFAAALLLLFTSASFR